MIAHSGSETRQSQFPNSAFPPEYWRSATLSEVLRSRSETLGDEVVFRFLADPHTDPSTISYAQLDRKARVIAHRLRELAEPGARAILLFPEGLECIAGMFGCLYAGLVIVSGVSPTASNSICRLIGIARDARASLVLGTAALL